MESIQSMMPCFEPSPMPLQIRDCRKNCVNFLDAIMHKEVTWYLTGLNSKNF